MATRVKRFSLDISHSRGTLPLVWSVAYTPVVDGSDGTEVALDDYSGRFDVCVDQMNAKLMEKISRLSESLLQAVASPAALETDGDELPIPHVELQTLMLTVGRPGPQALNTLTVTYSMPAFRRTSAKVLFLSELSPSIQRLIANVFPSFEQFAWNDLRLKLGAQPVIHTAKRVVFISYRKTKPEYEVFAEAVGHRLGREGFLPWLDEWEIHAGDSIVRKMADGFENVYAVILVLTDDYPAGKWAREELESAIVKRVDESIQVIPVKYDNCKVPELLRMLNYVDCTNHDPVVFESQFGRVIDALNGLELNPYR